MPDGGTLAISAQTVALDENYAQMYIEAKAGRYVLLTVKDTGFGMPPEVRQRVFDPFFTTKEIGKGTGLGLSTALAIVKSHGGFVNVYSEPGREAQFTIYLPAAKSESAADESKSVIPLQPDGKRQSLCAFYRRTACLPLVEEMLNGKDWSLREFIRRIETRFVEFSEIADLPGAEHFFFNVNTPADFNLARDIEQTTKQTSRLLIGLTQLNIYLIKIKNESTKSQRRRLH